MNMLVKLNAALAASHELHTTPAAIALHSGRSDVRRHIPQKPAEPREHVARS